MQAIKPIAIEIIYSILFYEQTFSSVAISKIYYFTFIAINVDYPFSRAGRHGRLYMDSGKFAAEETILHDAAFKFWESDNKYIQAQLYF